MDRSAAPDVVALPDSLPSQQATVVRWFLERIAAPGLRPADLDPEITATWRSAAMANWAVQHALSLAAGGRVTDVGIVQAGEIRVVIADPRGRFQELLLDFESAESARLVRLCVRPVLPSGVEVRSVGPADAAEMRRLELLARVRREDETEVIIDHAGRQFDHAAVVRDHRWLAVFEGDRMLAVQGVAVTMAAIGGRPLRIAYNHYSRSDPGVRHGGYLIHLVSTLYRDIFPVIDQFASVVDVQNTAGLRLSFGEPWPTRVQRLFLPVDALAARATVPPPRVPFDAARAATLLNGTHERMELWVPRSAAFIEERARRAPSVFSTTCWRMTRHATLAIWPSGERRTYRRNGSESTRRLALILDYGFAGADGQVELTTLLCEAAVECQAAGLSHLAMFVSEGFASTAWLGDLAESRDIYAVCGPALGSPLPTGPVYVDHLVF